MKKEHHILEIKCQIVEIKACYKKLKIMAKKYYLDPIDFPQEIKGNLRRLSHKKVELETFLKTLEK